MRTPEEIKEALGVCSYNGCDNLYCAYQNGGCTEELSRDALDYIELLESSIAGLEAKPAKPAPAQSGLPKGWIKLTYADGSAAFVNAANLTSFGGSDSFPHITEVCCGKDVNLVKESPEEIIDKIREAAT